MGLIARVLFNGRVLAEARHATAEQAAAWCAQVCPPEPGWTSTVRRERRRHRLLSLLSRVS